MVAPVAYHPAPGRDGGMEDAADSKSAGRKLVWVRVPLPVLEDRHDHSDLSMALSAIGPSI